MTYFQKIRSKLFFLIIGALFIFSYQNCQQYNQNDISKAMAKAEGQYADLASESGDVDDTESVIVPNPNDFPKGLTEQEEKERQKICEDNMAKMSISNASEVSLKTIVIDNGLGLEKSGDSPATLIQSLQLNLDTLLGSKNKTLEQTLNNGGKDCKYLRRFVVDVIDNNVVPFNLSRAVDREGLVITDSASLAEKTRVVRNIIRQSPTGANLNLDAGQTNLEIKFQIQFNQNTRMYYCADADFYYRIRAQVISQNLSRTVIKDSAPVFVKVKLNNKCYEEEKLIANEQLTTNSAYAAIVKSFEDWQIVLSQRQNAEGAVYLYKKDQNGQIIERQVITQRDQNDRPFSKIAVKNDLLLISRASKSYFEKDKLYENVGSVFIYKLNRNTNQWGYLQEIRPEAADLKIANQFYGSGLDIINSKTIAVGASGYKSSLTGSGNGALYLYFLDAGGTFIKKTTYLSKSGLVNLGQQILAGPQHLFVAAPGSSTNPVRGELRIFPYKSSVIATDFKDIDISRANNLPALAENVSLGGLFGYSMAVYNKTLFVAAPGHNRNTGVVLVYNDYTASNPAVTSKILASRSAVNNFFGSAISLNSRNLVIGCPNCISLLTFNTGTVEVRDLSKVLSKITNEIKFIVYPTDSAQGDSFGSALDFSSNNELLVGAPGKSQSHGASYLFKVQ